MTHDTHDTLPGTAPAGWVVRACQTILFGRIAARGELATRAGIGIGVMRVVMRVGVTPPTAVLPPVMRVMRHAQSKGLNRKDLLCVGCSVLFGLSLAGRGTLKAVHPGTISPWVIRQLE
jgi:hypothetical protein